MVDKLVRVGLGLILFALVKGDVYCPTEERDAVYRFNVLCDTTSPCNNLNIYCPKNSYTDILWLDCKGAHACANISVFSAVTTRVRCRSRTGACENVTVHCGDDVSAVLPSSALSLFTTSDQGNQEERPVSCKFRHMDAYVTRNSFFGCYGDVKSCVVLASDDNAYTDSRMRCETTDTPCVMQCLTGSSCLGNELQCAATDQSLCQCQSEANCGTVETIDVRGETTDSAIETTEYSETTEIESVSVSTTQVAQPTMSTSATDSNSASTEAEATQTSSSAIASTTTMSSTQQEQTSTEASQTSTSSESTTSVTSSTVGSTSTSASSISTSSISTSSTSTSSTTASTTQVSTVNGLENYHQETVKDNSHVMKSWQLALAIVMPILGVAIICLIGAYILKRWKNSNNQSNKEVKNEDSEPHKSISAQSVDGLTSPATTSTTEV